MNTQNSHKLITVIQELSKVRSLEEIMAIVRTAARELTGSDGATFVLKDDKYCFYADEDAIGPLWKGQRFPLQSCISGWSMLHKTPAIVPDIYKDPRIPVEAYRPTFVKSLVMVPIRADSPIGAIGNYWAEPHTPTPQEVEIVEALAATTSVAIENVQLYASLQKQIQELNQANRHKDELLEIVSHELRTPLNSILGWAQLLSGEEMPPEQMHEGIATIERNAKSQANIIDELMESSRIILGRLTLHRSQVDLVEVTKQSVDSFRARAKSKGLKLNLEEQISEATVMADPTRLRQIVDHLISNAIKFTTEGSIEVRMTREGPHAQLAVQDSGIGIRPESLPRIFDRFSQTDSSTTRTYGGLGLGLSIVKHLVTEFDGHISAESDGPNKGSVLRVSFPLLVQLQKKESPKSLPLHGLKVLVVDDEIDARILAQTALRTQGAEVKSADGAESAMATLPEFNPDVLVCDLSMPKEDGFSLMRKIRAGKVVENSALPSIALTAFADEPHREEAMRAGFHGFVGKPFKLNNLVETIRSIRTSP